MPRYHFHVSDGLNYPDREGTDLPNLESARMEAVRLFGTILAEESGRMKRGETWRMHVEDDLGLLLFRLEFTLTWSPSVKGW